MSEEEKAANRAAFKKMNLPQKAEYIFTYYKFPIIAAVIAIFFLSNAIYLQITRKETALYCSLVNVTVDGQLANRLTVGFLESMDIDPDKNDVSYSELNLSGGGQYAYSSRVKLMATIESQMLDVVLMDREAYDMLSANGYLLPLSELLSPDAGLAAELAPYLTENTVIVEDNQSDVERGTADEYWSETEDVVNGLNISGFRLFAGAGFSEDLYLGVIGNTARPEMVRSYIGYLNMA